MSIARGIINIILICLLLRSAAYAEDIKKIESNEITIAIEDANNSPYSSYQEGRFQGFHVELMNELADFDHFKIKWQALPWTRALKSLQAGLIHAVTYITPNKERNEYAIFDKNNYLHFDQICLFVRANLEPKVSWDGAVANLPKIKYGFNTNYFIAQDIEDAKSRVEHLIVNGTTENLLQMLLANRIDGFFSLPSAMRTVTLYRQNESKIQILTPCRRGDNRYIAFSKAHTQGRIWNDRIALAFEKYRKTDAYKKLLQKYEMKHLEELEK